MGGRPAADLLVSLPSEVAGLEPRFAAAADLAWLAFTARYPTPLDSLLHCYGRPGEPPRHGGFVVATAEAVTWAVAFNNRPEVRNFYASQDGAFVERAAVLYVVHELTHMRHFAMVMN